MKNKANKSKAASFLSDNYNKIIEIVGGAGIAKLQTKWGCTRQNVYQRLQGNYKDPPPEEVLDDLILLIEDHVKFTEQARAVLEEE